MENMEAWSSAPGHEIATHKPGYFFKVQHVVVRRRAMRLPGAKCGICAISNTSRCGSVGVELRNYAALRAGIERSRRDLAILHLSGPASTASDLFHDLRIRLAATG